MSGLKYLVVVLLVETARSNPPHLRHVRSSNLQVQPSYSYPYPYPYQPGYGVQNSPGISQSYPYQQVPSWMTVPSYPSFGSGFPSYPSFGSGLPSYPSYGSGFPSYPSYSSNPYYPTYPHQSNFQNYPDPYAHIPTEIIDVDDDGNFDLGFEIDQQLPVNGQPGLSDGPIDPGFSLGGFLPKVEVTSSHNSTVSGPSNVPLRPVYTQMVTTKPITTTITRTFGSNSEPNVDVKYSSPEKHTGSGVVIEATENKPDGEDTTNNQAAKGSEEEKKEDEEEKKDDEEGGKGFTLWG